MDSATPTHTPPLLSHTHNVHGTNAHLLIGVSTIIYQDINATTGVKPHSIAQVMRNDISIPL